MRVLVAEDNPVNLLVATTMLETLGCVVASAANGLEAVEIANRETFDLILMDCHMPVMDGFEATERLGAELGERCPPVIGFTASATRADRARCHAVGIIEILPKPITIERLSDALRPFASIRRVRPPD